MQHATQLVRPLAFAGISFGLMGTLASAYIYLVKARPAWNTLHTPADFLLSAGLIGATLPGVMQQPASALADMLAHFGLHVPHTSTSVPLSVVTTLAVLWAANLVTRVFRLRASRTFEARASYNLLRGEALWWRVALALLTCAATALFSTVPLPVPALLAAITAVALGRYLFFVSVVPLSMGLTFIGGRSAEAHA